MSINQFTTAVLIQLVTSAWDFIKPIWELLVKFLNSNFGTAATGSFFGAVGGFFLVEYSNFRKGIYQKVIAINVAISFSLDILNTMLSFKKQHVKNLYERYTNDKKKFIDDLAAATKGVKRELNYLSDWQTLVMPTLPTDLLFKNIQEKVNLSGKALLLLTTILRVAEGLEKAIRVAISQPPVLATVRHDHQVEAMAVSNLVLLGFGLKMAAFEVS
jgi:hypothetical protein